MKRRLFSLVLILLLLGHTAVLADDKMPMSSAAAYYIDEALYAFAQFPDYQDEEELQVGLMVNNVQVGPEQTAHKLTEQQEPAEYMLLVDCSTSMPEYLDRIQALGDQIISRNVSVTVATFGVQFRVVAQGLTDAQTLRDTLANLSYNEEGTDICGGAAYGVDYMRDNAWSPGQLSSVILITDGIPFYSHNQATETQSEAQAAAALREVLDKSPQVLLHSVCFESWEPVTADAVSSGNGYQLSASNAQQAAEAGQVISDFYDSIYGLEFPLEEFTENLSLRISNTEIVTIRLLSDLTEPEDDSMFDAIPIVIDVESDPEAGGENPESPPPEESPAPSEPAEPEEPEETPAPSEPEGPKGVAPAEPVPEASPNSEGSAVESPAEAPTPVPSAAPEEQKPQGLATWMIAAIIAGAALLLILAAVVIAIALRSRKRRNEPASRTVVPQPAPAVGIPLGIEIRSGSAQGQPGQIFLSESLLIGSDNRCDLVLTGGGVAPVHSRIFLQNGRIYIEDLNSAGGTAIGGMRIYAPNLLPSGEEVTIGRNVIVFHYG